MNSRTWQQRFRAKLASPQPLFLDADGAATLAALPGGTAVDVIVSARLLHELVCEPGLPLHDEPARQAYARQMFGHYFGAAAQRWPLASWAAVNQQGASALHGLDWPALAQTAEAADVQVRRVQPAWAPLLQRLMVDEPDWSRAPAAALAWVEGQVLTWLVLRDGQVQQLRQLRLPTATQAALGELLAELRTGESVLVVGYGLDSAATPVWPGVRVLHRLDGASPDLAWFAPVSEPNARLPQPDFLGPRIGRARLAWPLAVVGALALLLAGAGLWASQQGLNEAQERLAQLQTRGGLLPAKAALKKAAPAQVQASRAAAEVQALLRQPWEPLLANVEQVGAEQRPVGQLSWLGLDYAAGRNELRLEGLTQDKLMALQLADRLAAAPGWREVVLSRFQTGEQGLSGQRFELSARLTPSLLTATLPAKDKR
jgi:hypothetical protein